MEDKRLKLLSQVRMKIALCSALFLFISISICTRKLLGWSVFGEAFEFIFFCLGFVTCMAAYQKCEDVMDSEYKQVRSGIMQWYFIVSMTMFAAFAALDLLLLLQSLKEPF